MCFHLNLNSTSLTWRFKQKALPGLVFVLLMNNNPIIPFEQIIKKTMFLNKLYFDLKRLITKSNDAFVLILFVLKAVKIMC